MSPKERRPKKDQRATERKKTIPGLKRRQVSETDARRVKGGAASFKEFTFTKQIDKSSPK